MNPAGSDSRAGVRSKANSWDGVLRLPQEHLPGGRRALPSTHRAPCGSAGFPPASLSPAAQPWGRFMRAPPADPPSRRTSEQRRVTTKCADTWGSFQEDPAWTSLVVRWLRLRLPMRDTVQSLVREDPTGRRATKPPRATRESPCAATETQCHAPCDRGSP